MAGTLSPPSGKTIELLPPIPGPPATGLRQQLLHKVCLIFIMYKFKNLRVRDREMRS